MSISYSPFPALPDFVASEATWSAAAQIELPAAGRRREYTVMDVLVMAAAHHLFGSAREATRMLADPAVWGTLQQTAEQAFPNGAARRLSPTAPSRTQYHRARQHLGDARVLDAAESDARRHAAQAAVDAGLFTAAPKDCAPPDATQCVAADTVQLGDQQVILLVAGGIGTPPIILDTAVMSRADRARLSSSDLVVEMLGRLLDECGDILRDGLKAFVHDGALDPKALEAVAVMGVVPIVRMPRQRGGNLRDLGVHIFTAPDGTTHKLEVMADNGAPIVVIPTNSGTVLPRLRWQRIYRRDQRRDSALFGCFEIPGGGGIPARFAGATTEIPLTSTAAEARNPSTRRSRVVRPIPEGDLAFEALCGLRVGVEVCFADLKRRGMHIGTYPPEGLRLRMLAYHLLNIAAAHARRDHGTTPLAA